METGNWGLETRKFKSGIVSLGAIFLMGTIIVEVVLVFALLVYFLNQGSLGARLSAEALAAAQAGVDDALLKIIRGTDSAPSYDISLPSGKAQVSICKGGDPGCEPTINAKRKITSTGIVSLKKRQLIAVVEVDPQTRLLKIESVSEKI